MTMLDFMFILKDTIQNNFLTRCLTAKTIWSFDFTQKWIYSPSISSKLVSVEQKNYMFKKDVITKQLLVPIDYRIIFFIVWKSVAAINCLVNNILQNIFCVCVFNKRMSHESLKTREFGTVGRVLKVKDDKYKFLGELSYYWYTGLVYISKVYCVNFLMWHLTHICVRWNPT